MRRPAGCPADRSGSDGQKGGFKATFDDAITQEIDSLVGPGSIEQCDLETLEWGARRFAHDRVARAIERRFNADTSDEDAGRTRPCPRGHTARFVDRRGKGFTTAVGVVTLQRAYYHCATCGEGFCPRDLALGIAGTSFFPAAVRMVGEAAAGEPFEWSSALLHHLAGLSVDPKQVERTAEALGAEIAEDERDVVEPSSSDAGLPPVMYLGEDGTGVPMRPSEVEGRAGKQPDGSAKTREVKVLTVWTAQSRDKDGHPMRDPGSVRYSAAIESAARRDTDPEPSPFEKRIRRAITRTGYDKVKRRVWLADGAKYNWNLADACAPDALQILDLFHAKERVHTVANAIWGPQSELGAQWAKQRCDEIDADAVDALLASLHAHASDSKPAREAIEYFRNNRDRMHYPAYRADGLCVGSGVTEAACKAVVGDRLKATGMHWTLKGANAILALRCCVLSDGLNDFFERRAERRRARQIASSFS